MSKNELQTEFLIKNKAKELFFKIGALDASTQAIADFAQVNRTLVNYYFRSKKNLFQLVHTEIINEVREKYQAIYLSKQTFKSKVEELMDVTIEFRMKYPYLEIFNIHEWNKKNSINNKLQGPKPLEGINQFIDEIKWNMENDKIPKYDPINFMLNIFSLISFPFLMEPVYVNIFNIKSVKEYQEILAQRKDMAMSLLFNE